MIQEAIKILSRKRRVKIMNKITSSRNKIIKIGPSMSSICHRSTLSMNLLF